MNNLIDRHKLIKVDASLGLSIIGGLINTTGKTKYTLDQRYSNNEVTVSILVETVTSKEYIPQELKEKIRYKNLCEKIGHTDFLSWFSL